MKNPRGLDFSSNDYLGLSRNPELNARLREHWGDQFGATGSRLLTGQSDLYEEVETFLARHFATESALIFGSGYLANLGVVSALTDGETALFSDQLNHASLIDGARLSRAHVQIYRHNDLGHLRELLNQSSAKKKVIATESVFSMDGDLAPVSGLIEVAEEFSAVLILDEAHATGIFGDQGKGLAHGLTFENLVVVHTCGKSLGGYGAFVTSSAQTRDVLINRARSFIYSTALPVPVVKQMELSLRFVAEHPELPSRLRRNMSSAAEIFGTSVESAIVSLFAPGNERALRIQRAFETAGVDVRAIRAPTVAPGSERLRLTIKAFHSREDLELCGQLWRHFT